MNNIALPTTGSHAKSLELAEFKLECLASHLKEIATHGNNIAPKVIAHIHEEIIQALDLLANVDRENPDNL